MLVALVQKVLVVAQIQINLVVVAIQTLKINLMDAAQPKPRQKNKLAVSLIRVAAKF